MGYTLVMLEMRFVPSVFSTSLKRWMNFFFLPSVCAPMGLERSRKVLGLVRSRVWNTNATSLDLLATYGKNSRG